MPVYKTHRGTRIHVLVAEAALGHSLPKGACVHHVNGDKHDNRPVNLVICQDHAYHVSLHRRARVIKAGGNPNTQKICCECQTLKDIGNGIAAGRRNQCDMCKARRSLASYYKNKHLSDRLCACGCGERTWWDPVRKHDCRYRLGHVGRMQPRRRTAV